MNEFLVNSTLSETSTNSSSSMCWINGILCEPSLAVVSVYDHGFLYGDGVFEGIRFYNGKVFRLGAHLQRLRNSLAALSIEINYSDVELSAAIAQLILASNHSSAYVRLIVTRGVGTLGIDPRSCSNSSVIMILAPLQLSSTDQQQLGLRVIVSSVRRISANMLDPKTKSLNYLNNILARMQATAAGVDEAIMLNAQGYVTEASTENIFLVKKGNLITPAVTEGLLEGITRAEIIKLAQQEGIDVKQQRVTVDELYAADEVFLTGTGAELLFVSEVDGYKISSQAGELFSKLNGKFKQLTQD